MIRRPPRSTLVPFTTLFRSPRRQNRVVYGLGCQFHVGLAVRVRIPQEICLVFADHLGWLEVVDLLRSDGGLRVVSGEGDLGAQRSEEHTSELQSRQYLVCRL